MYNFNQKFLKIIFGFVFIVLLTQLEIDLQLGEINIPVTGQSLAVLVVAVLLGSQLGALAIGLYLLVGGLGLPVFADGASGWAIFTKGSGGYLIGFLVAGVIIGYLAEKMDLKKIGIHLWLMLLGTAIILTCGVGGLTRLYGFEKALEYGFYPFLWGGLIKILIGGMLTYGVGRSGVLSSMSSFANSKKR